MVENSDGFVRLGQDEYVKTPGHLERVFIEQIAHADFLYVANKDGYIGRSVATEMGYALSIGRPVILAQPIQQVSSEVDKSFSELLLASPYAVVEPQKILLTDIAQILRWQRVLQKVCLSKEQKGQLKKPAEELLKQYALAEIKQKAKSSHSLGELSIYVAQKAKKRGFSDETMEQKAALMAEEKGELASALRRFSGIKKAADSLEFRAEPEAADLFFLLLDFCSQKGVDWSREDGTLNERQVQVAEQSKRDQTVSELFYSLEMTTPSLLGATSSEKALEAAQRYLDILLQICTTSGIGLERSFWEKELVNEERQWR